MAGAISNFRIAAFEAGTSKLDTESEGKITDILVFGSGRIFSLMVIMTMKEAHCSR